MNDLADHVEICMGRHLAAAARPATTEMVILTTEREPFPAEEIPMFGVEKRVERVRQALIKAFQSKSMAIMKTHAAKQPDQIPKHDLARSLILMDLAEILTNLKVEKHPEDET